MYSGTILGFTAMVAVAAVVTGAAAVQDESGRDPYVLAVRLVHTFVIAMLTMYVFVVPSPGASWDAAFLAFVVLTVGHWHYMDNECVLSVVESRIRDPAYVPGSDIDRNIRSVVGERYASFLNASLTLLMLLNAVLVAWRIGVVQRASVPVAAIVLTTIVVLTFLSVGSTKVPPGAVYAGIGYTEK
jgi:hypothetical protein